jgi:ferredoxin
VTSLTAIIDTNKCASWGACVDVCIPSAISMDDGQVKIDNEKCCCFNPKDEGWLETDAEYWLRLPACVDSCPSEAIHMK